MRRIRRSSKRSRSHLTPGDRCLRPLPVFRPPTLLLASCPRFLRWVAGCWLRSPLRHHKLRRELACFVERTSKQAPLFFGAGMRVAVDAQPRGPSLFGAYSKRGNMFAIQGLFVASFRVERRLANTRFSPSPTSCGDGTFSSRLCRWRKPVARQSFLVEPDRIQLADWKTVGAWGKLRQFC
jgi:hypothetical protein